MKRLMAALSATALMAIGGGAAMAAASGAPEIDEANATLTLRARSSRWLVTGAVRR